MESQPGEIGRTLDERVLRRLMAVGRTLVSQLDLEAVLQELLEVARELTGARYAALGILDSERRGLEDFHALGIDDETREAIGDLPRGPGSPRPPRRRGAASATGGRRLAPTLLRLPPRPPPDAQLPGRADRDPGPGLGQPLPHREGGRPVHRGRRGRPGRPGRVGVDRDRQRPAFLQLRGPPPAAGTSGRPPGGHHRDRARSRRRDEPRTSAGDDREASASPGRGPLGRDPARGQRRAGGRGDRRRVHPRRSRRAPADRLDHVGRRPARATARTRRRRPRAARHLAPRAWRGRAGGAARAPELPGHGSRRDRRVRPARVRTRVRRGGRAPARRVRGQRRHRRLDGEVRRLRAPAPLDRRLRARAPPVGARAPRRHPPGPRSACGSSCPRRPARARRRSS